VSAPGRKRPLATSPKMGGLGWAKRGRCRCAACVQLAPTEVPAVAFTRSRNSLPGLKCGTYFPARATGSPVFGLRPIRGGRKRREKLPNPRISIRAPAANASVMCRSTALTASSTSSPSRWGCCLVRRSISSDFVTVRVSTRHPLGHEPQCICSSYNRYVKRLVRLCWQAVRKLDNLLPAWH